MRFLCDTNIISEAMKRSPNPDVKQWLNQEEGICLSVITVEEVYSGLTYKNAEKQREWFEKFLRERCRVLSVSSAIAVRCGKWRGQFRKQGIIRTQADLLIAATAYEYQLVLATRNIKDFEDCDIRLFNPFDKNDKHYENRSNGRANSPNPA